MVNNMEKRELVLVWLMGFTLCVEQILAFRIIGADLYAFFPIMIIMVSLSAIKDKDGENIFPLIEKLVKKRNLMGNFKR